jgi:hypothetical protein
MEIKYLSENRTTSLKKNKAVDYITYDALDKLPWLVHAFSTRNGGVSDGIWSSMNLNFNVGDDRSRVVENFERFGAAIGVPVENMIFSHQTHTVNVLRADKTMAGMGILRDRSFHDIDGLVTNEPGICLVTSYADCVPLYFVDEKNKAIGLSHSGWRGTVGNIAGNTVELMRESFGTCPEDLLVCIGPSICLNCYEVSADVAAQFQECYGADTKDILFEKENGKYMLNLHEACRVNLLRAGVRYANIILPDLCTCCNPKLLFSHRASGGKRGGLCAFLGIRE